MAIRVSGRRVVRSLIVALLAACPLVAADPPRVTLGPPTAHTEAVLPASYTGPSAGVDIPPLPLGRYPERYAGLDWGRLSDQLAAVKRRNAARVPFDLKYLPPARERSWKPEVVAAVRPCAIFDRPHGDRLVSEWLVKTGLLDLAKSFFGLSGVNWPAMQDIDMIAVRGHLDAGLMENGTQFRLGVNDAHGAVIRTREPYPWRRELARAAPALGTATYRGVEYRTTKVDLKRFFPQFKDKDEDLVLTGLYVADDYTLVIDSEDAVERLIDRLLDAEPAEVPAGWGQVSGGICAMAVSCPSKGWTSELPGAIGPRLPKGGDWEWNVLDDLHELLMGLDDRPTTRFYLSAGAFDPFAGKRMIWNAKRLLELIAAYLAEGEGAEVEQARAIWRKATFTPTLRGFEISVDAENDLLNPLLDGFASKAPPAEPGAYVGWPGRYGTPAPPGLPPTSPPLPRGTGSSVPPGEPNKGGSDLPPIPMAPPAPGFYGRSPLNGLGDRSQPPPGF